MSIRGSKFDIMKIAAKKKEPYSFEVFPKGLNMNKMANIIYPLPEKKDQWLKAMGDVFNKGFMTEEELYKCFELGGMPETILKKIKIRMDLFYKEFKCN